MARSNPFVEHVLELLAPLGPVRSRAMFGGHGLYLDGLFVAIIADEGLYLKADAASQGRFAAAGGQPFVYATAGREIRLNFWSPPAEALDSPALMAPWARLALQAALAARAAAGPARALKAPPPADAQQRSRAKVRQTPRKQG